jgi:hypothetical protein
MPALILVVPAFVILLLALKSAYLRNALATASIFTILLLQYNDIPAMLTGYKERNSDRKKTSQYVQERFKKDDPLVLVPNYYGHAFLQYAHYFGSWWSGPNGRELVYRQRLKELYPNTFIYNPVEKFFHDWGERIPIGDILDKHPAMYVSVGWQMEKPFQDVVSIIDTVTTDYTLDTLYRNDRSEEKIFLLNQYQPADLPEPHPGR